MIDNNRNNLNKLIKFKNYSNNEDSEMTDYMKNKLSSNKNFKNENKFYESKNKIKDPRSKPSRKQTEKEEQFAIVQKAKNYEEELEKIKERVGQETPPCGYYYFNKDDFNLSESESDNENRKEDSKSINNNEENKDNTIIKDEEESPNHKNLWKREKFYFKDLPISRKTIKGLSESKFIKMTPVQRYTLPHSLACRDILGASKTGSGKTLCFIIPVLECLYRQKWTSLDGLGALLILPTRELAMQVFEVFRLVGKYHDFSIGLVIGGNNLEDEKSSLYKINILIGTPGRLSQHFSETANFNTDNIQILCIDEADRILDEGFEEALNEIISYLPSKKRQTLLFSATLSRDLRRMAKVSLKSPEYINVSNTDAFLSAKAEIADSNAYNANIKNNNKNLHMDKINLNLNDNPDSNNNNNNSSKGQSADFNNPNANSNNDLTPINLNQFYTVCETHEKLDILFSFLKSHKNAKCLIFLSSCKQVRYYAEIFRRLKLGMTFLDLHGKQKQGKRTNIFYTFLNKKNSVLFATDIASRGVDFPAVDWVIQLDCPEDISTYIHRVGRTARYKSKGNSLLLVNRTEEKLVQILQSKNVNIKKLKINTSKVVGLQPILRSLISENSDLIHLAQKAIKSYLKSVYLQSKKDIFDIKAIDVQQLALSYGLVNLPEVKISRKSENDLKNLKKSVVNGQDAESDEDSSDLEVDEEDAEYFQGGPRSDKSKKKSKLQKLKEKIAEKRQLKSKELNDIMMNDENGNLVVAKNKKEEAATNKEKKEDNGLLKLKRKSENKSAEVNEKVNKKEMETDLVVDLKIKEKSKVDKENNDEKPQKNKIEENKKNDFYEKLKSKLVLNEDEDKIKEKARIHDKHRADRLKRKELDYEKHGLNDEESAEEEEFGNEIEDEEQQFAVNKAYLEDLALNEEKKQKENGSGKKPKKNEYVDSDGEIYNFKFVEDKKLKNKDKPKSMIKKGNFIFQLNNDLFFFS